MDVFQEEDGVRAFGAGPRIVCEFFEVEETVRKIPASRRRVFGKGPKPEMLICTLQSRIELF